MLRDTSFCLTIAKTIICASCKDLKLYFIKDVKHSRFLIIFAPQFSNYVIGLCIT